MGEMEREGFYPTQKFNLKKNNCSIVFKKKKNQKNKMARLAR
jgi:hypothetical protein